MDTQQPLNYSFAHPTDFRATVEVKDKKVSANLTTYIQSFETPSFTSSVITKRKRGVEIALSNDFKTKTDVSLEFIIDDMFWVYTQMIDIFNSGGELEALTLYMLDSTSNPIIAMAYKKASIINIGSITLRTTVDGIEFLTLPVDVSFLDYSYERIQS